MPSGSLAVSSVDSPGVSSIQLSDQKTGAIRPPDCVRAAARTLKRECARCIFEAQANGMAFDFSMRFHLRLRQAREGRQIFMAGCRSARVFGLVPVKCGQRSRNPVEVSAQTLAGGIGESQIDEKDALGSRVESSREW